MFTSVGLLTVIGLGEKRDSDCGIRQRNESEGHALLDATLYASRQRLRPILMTSLAFIFGVLPMATSTGAGSGSQHAVGTGVMGNDLSNRSGYLLCTPVFRADTSPLPAEAAPGIRSRPA